MEAGEVLLQVHGLDILVRHPSFPHTQLHLQNPGFLFRFEDVCNHQHEAAAAAAAFTPLSRGSEGPRGYLRRFMAVMNLLCCPFVLMFLLIYFFMRNAEKFYHHPSSAGARRWSSLAAWRLREFNELPHYLNHRWFPHGNIVVWKDCQ